MERVRGRILKGDEVLVDDLEITLKVGMPPFSHTQWGGGFILTEPAVYIEPGGPYRLELEDGRSGDITVTKATYSIESRSWQVLFAAAGLLIERTD